MVWLQARNSGNGGKFPVVKGESNSKGSLCPTPLPAHTSAPAVHFGSEWGVHNVWLEDHSDSCWLCCLMCAWIQLTNFWGSSGWRRNWASIVLPWRQRLNAKEVFPEVHKLCEFSLTDSPASLRTQMEQRLTQLMVQCGPIKVLLCGFGLVH